LGHRLESSDALQALVTRFTASGVAKPWHLDRLKITLPYFAGMEKRISAKGSRKDSALIAIAKERSQKQPSIVTLNVCAEFFTGLLMRVSFQRIRLHV
jgi:hypothetical protein